MKNLIMAACVAAGMTTSAMAAAAGDPAAGKTKAVTCASCHGSDGNSANPEVNPSLAGLNAADLATATRQYQDGTRKNDVMKAMVINLSDQDIEDIAAFYASQKPR